MSSIEDKLRCLHSAGCNSGVLEIKKKKLFFLFFGIPYELSVEVSENCSRDPEK